MPIYPLTDANGNEYDVEAPDVESAVKALQDQRQQTANQALIKEADVAPEWTKPFMAMRDVATVGADTLTGGFGTQAVKGIFGGEPEMDVAARRNRMGWAAPALDVGVMATMIPTAVPKIVAKMGGGPAARALVGTGAAATEGGIVGGVQAAGHDEDIGSGVLAGGAGGALGQQVGGILNKGYKAIRGIDDSVPQGIRSKITVLPKNASSTDKVTVAANTAESKSRLFDDPLTQQAKTKDAIEKLLRTEPKSFTPNQRTLMNRVVDEDPATKISRYLGNTLTDKLAVSGAGVASGLANPLAGMAVAGGMLGTGRALKGVSAGGTKEAMDDLLREMRGRAKYKGILSPGEGGVLTKAARQMIMEKMLEE